MKNKQIKHVASKSSFCVMNITHDLGDWRVLLFKDVCICKFCHLVCKAVCALSWLSDIYHAVENYHHLHHHHHSWYDDDLFLLLEHSLTCWLWFCRVESSQSLYRGFCGQVVTETATVDTFCNCGGSSPGSCSTSQYLSTCQTALTTLRHGKWWQRQLLQWAHSVTGGSAACTCVCARLYCMTTLWHSTQDEQRTSTKNVMYIHQQQLLTGV